MLFSLKQIVVLHLELLDRIESISCLGGRVISPLMIGHCGKVLLVIVDFVNKEEIPHLPSVGGGEARKLAILTPYFKYN